MLLSTSTKICPCARHEGMLGSGGLAPCICNLRIRYRRVISFTPWPFYPHEKTFRSPLNKRIFRPRAGMDDLEKSVYPSAIQADYTSPPVYSPTSYTKWSRLFNFSIEYSQTFLILLKNDLCKSSTNSITQIFVE
jgi:hypothetical protein